MSYSSLADLINASNEEVIIQLTDDEGTESVNTDRVLSAIKTADDLIDGYIRGRYNVPLTESVGIIKTISVDVAIYKLHERRLETDMPDSLVNRYKNALKMLEQIQKGVLTLGIATISETSGAGGTVSGGGDFRTNKKASDRVFDRDTLRRY